MSITAEPTEIDTDKLMSFVFRAVDEVGATLNAALVVMGDKLGLLPRPRRARAEHAGAAGRAHPDRRAVRPRVAQRAGRRRLRHVRPRDEALHAAAEHALAMTDPDSPAFLPGFFQIALGTVHDTQHIVEAARSGAGYGWHQHDTDVHVGCERFFRPSYHANLVDSWIPALDGVAAEAARRARSSPTSAAGTGHPRSCSRRRSRTRPSSGRTTTPSRSPPRKPAPPRRG